jgi:hypothetical protein
VLPNSEEEVPTIEAFALDVRVAEIISSLNVIFVGAAEVSRASEI